MALDLADHAYLIETGNVVLAGSANEANGAESDLLVGAMKGGRGAVADEGLRESRQRSVS